MRSSSSDKSAAISYDMLLREGRGGEEGRRRDVVATFNVQLGST